jgi:hypothetical protein
VRPELAVARPGQTADKAALELAVIDAATLARRARPARRSVRHVAVQARWPAAPRLARGGIC